MHYSSTVRGHIGKGACWRWKLIGEGSLLETQLVGEGLLERGVIVLVRGLFSTQR